MAKKLRAGKGAIGIILTRFILPKQPFNNKDDRCRVVLVDQFSTANQKKYFHFRYEGDDDQSPLLNASHQYVKVLKEGPAADFFDGPSDQTEEERDGEPKIKWKKSKARSLLCKDVKDGVVTSTMALKDIYKMHPEYSCYHYEKFSARLSAIRKSIRDLDGRAKDDEIAFKKYTQNHPVSIYSHGGYPEWQNSVAQENLQEDIDDGLHISMKKSDLHASRPEYYEQFPLPVFRDKIEQELGTAKYLFTLKEKGKQHKSS
jgi:hypothetical protein